MHTENKINLSYRFLMDATSKMEYNDAKFVLKMNEYLSNSYFRIQAAGNHKIPVIKQEKRFIIAQRAALIRVYRPSNFLIFDSQNIVDEFNIGSNGLQELKVFKVN